jgi:predicted transglutaminase-like cysteine proteinase
MGDYCGVKRWVAVVILFICLGILLLPAARADEGGRKAVHLFGSVEFRTSLEVLPHWQRVRKVAEAQMARLITWKGEGCPRSVTQWQQMVAAARRQPKMEGLITVNRFFNRWPYRLDGEVYGASDYWATPEEFMIHSGDCEDYGIAKYYTLRQMGFLPAQLRLVVVQDRIRGIGHAVLAVYLDGGVFILDNLTNQVLPHTMYRHYLPQYSVNEAHGWAHLLSKKISAIGDVTNNKNKVLGSDP